MVVTVNGLWNLGSFSPQMSDIVSKLSNISDEDPKGRTWTLRRYYLLRSAESVLPKPLEILADAEKYTSFRGMKVTISILATFGFLKTVERSTRFVDRLSLFGNVPLIMKRVTASCLPYLAEENEEAKPSINSAKYPTNGKFDEIFPILIRDLVDHTKEYGVPQDTWDWYQNVSN